MGPNIFDHESLAPSGACAQHATHLTCSSPLTDNYPPSPSLPSRLCGAGGHGWSIVAEPSGRSAAKVSTLHDFDSGHDMWSQTNPPGPESRNMRVLDK